MPGERQSQSEQPASAKSKALPTASAVLENGGLLEPAYDPDAKRTSLAIWEDNACRIVPSYTLPSGERRSRTRPGNNLIKNDVVLLPSGPEEYGSEADLIAAIQAFIHRYVDLTPQFERLVSYYVLFTWLYDAFNELPYFRIRGDYGSGKTRFLLIVGALCNKPVFASGASTVSPIFHILDAFRGTLIIDEGDFRWSDDKADIVKILNNGNVRGLPVLRTEVSKDREFNPLGLPGVRPEDRSDPRLLRRPRPREPLHHRRKRPSAAEGGHPDQRAGHVQTAGAAPAQQAPPYRFRHFDKVFAADGLVDPAIEPRLNQIFIPLLSVVADPAVRAELRASRPRIQPRAHRGPGPGRRSPGSGGRARPPGPATKARCRRHCRGFRRALRPRL